MRNLDPDILQELTKLRIPNAWVFLLAIQMTDDSATVVRYARDYRDVTYNDNVYTAFSFEPMVVAASQQGQIPRATLILTNLGRELISYLHPTNYMDGGTVTLTGVSWGFLTANYTDLTTTYDIGQAEDDADKLTLEVSGPDLLTYRCPRRRFLPICDIPFKGAHCGYTGGEVDCNKTLARCRDLGNESRWGGFSGMRSGTIKVIQ